MKTYDIKFMHSSKFRVNPTDPSTYNRKERIFYPSFRLTLQKLCPNFLLVHR